MVWHPGGAVTDTVSGSVKSAERSVGCMRRAAPTVFVPRLHRHSHRALLAGYQAPPATETALSVAIWSADGGEARPRDSEGSAAGRGRLTDRAGPHSRRPGMLPVLTYRGTVLEMVDLLRFAMVLPAAAPP